MRLIVYACSIDNHPLFDIYIVKGAVVGNVVVGVLQVEPVAECFDTILNQFLLRRFRGDGVGLVVDGGGYALKADKRKAVDSVIGLCFENYCCPLNFRMVHSTPSNRRFYAVGS